MQEKIPVIHFAFAVSFSKWGLSHNIKHTFAVALFPMIRSGGVLDRSEGFCLLLGYAVYLYWLWPK